MATTRRSARSRPDDVLAKAICRLIAEGRDTLSVTKGREEPTRRALLLAQEKGWLVAGELTRTGRLVAQRSRAGTHRTRASAF